MADAPKGTVGDRSIPLKKPHLRFLTDEEVEARGDVYSQADPARPGFT